MQQIRPVYAPLIQRLRRGVDALVDEVVHDVALPGESRAEVAAQVRPPVEWMLDALAEAEQLLPPRLAELRVEGRRAANLGDSLQRLLDRYLSTGWVLWGAATREAATPDAGDTADTPTIAALGTALLKAGDAAAAAIATGFGEAERALAVRAAGARREFVDELLDLAPADAEAAARLRRRSADFGLDPAAGSRLVVATLGGEIEDGSPELDALAEALARGERPLPRRDRSRPGDRPTPAPVVASRRGRVVILVPTDGPLPAALRPALDELAPQGWLAVATPPVAGLTHLAEAYGTAVGALAVAARLGRQRLVDSDEVLLERALLADEPLLAGAVAQELGPILGARRNATALIDTVAAYLENAENLRATARQLGVAPRTVAYRLARVATLLGEPLRGPRVLRVAAALLAARLLGRQTSALASSRVPAARAAFTPGTPGGAPGRTTGTRSPRSKAEPRDAIGPEDYGAGCPTSASASR